MFYRLCTALLLTSSLTLLNTGCAQQEISQEPVQAEAEPVQMFDNIFRLWGAEMHDMHSEHTGRDYQITVRLPNGYDSKNDYPVIYVLDAQWQLPLIYNLAGALWYDASMPDVILVGVAWKDLNQRNNDLSPVPTDFAPEGGDAKLFQAFFNKELIPSIESKYGKAPKRVVTGGSSSALFVFYTLLTAPETFDAYIASSPVVSWGDSVLMKTLADTPQDYLSSKKQAYLAWGEYEHAFNYGEQVEAFGTALAAREFTNLSFNQHEVSGAGHSAVNPESYTRGLQFVFQKQDLPLSEEQLKHWAGHYLSEDGKDEFKIIERDGRLAYAYQNYKAFTLKANSTSELYGQGEGLILSRTEDGQLLSWFHGTQVYFNKQ
ncbi:alpha/beta hydrolase [Agaribacterium sp. ZY112]|uniref:alpha/beta hydrolase n=1 Tax=Agaribacterium sp. ZY112 TaxID=3233574 RepID=UPI0035247050